VSQPLKRAVVAIDMRLMAAKYVLLEAEAPLSERLTWLAGELESLSEEAYRLADEANALGPTPPDGHTPS
jgi:hypothetical protein